ncbi:MAG TPA: class I SAM-dependent methyltransferase [Stellaceae bacterium]|jgi:2-polyprenyl-3-methyl-5-hydroxy-6-metoxy-1,4-benzoquinol methylase|nr:class I SAM-dependent methyltransferase [Stellaceae bacterium]
MIERVLQGYAAAAGDLIARFEEVSPDQLYAPVADLLPSAASKIADIGAGTGRDAAWLAEQGHDVVAVEPVDELRQAGMALHKSQRIEWCNDRLPRLRDLGSRESSFDRVLLSAVWQHLDDEERCIALRTLADLTAPGGMLILSLRHGPGASSRPVYEARPKDTIRAARHAGFELIRERQAPSLQAANRAAGVRWTWLAFGLP